MVDNRNSALDCCHTDAQLRASLTRLKGFTIQRHLAYHVIGSLLLLSAVALVHLQWHESYKAEVRPLLRRAVQAYQIREADDGRYAVFVNGTAVVSRGLDRVDGLGIGRLASAIGVLESAFTSVRSFNLSLQEATESWRAHIRPYAPDRVGRSQAPLQAFGAGLEPDRILELPIDVAKKQEAIPSNMIGVRALRALVLGARCFDTGKTTVAVPVEIRAVARPETRVPATSPFGISRLAHWLLSAADQSPRMQSRSRDPSGLDHHVDTAVRAVGAAYEKVANDVALTYSLVTDTSERSPTVRAHAAINKRLDDAWQRTLGPLVGRSPFADPMPAKEGSSETVAARAHVPSPFHGTLRLVAEDELGVFWVFGVWRWLEVVMITSLGVMTEALVRLGLHYSGRQPRVNGRKVAWGHQETGRTVLKMLYAPVSSLIAIWTLITLQVLDVEVSGLTTGAGVVTLAFLFGLFPNLPFTLFKRLAEAVFQSTSVATSRPALAATSTRSESLATFDPKDPVPLFTRLKGGIRQHVTAALKEGNS